MNHPLDAVIAKQTGFSSMADMLASHPNYRPSLDMRESWARDVADAYDAEQAKAGDPRRAYRYAIAEGAKLAAEEAAAAKMTPLQKAKDAVSEARGECKRALKRAHPELRWHRSRGQLLWICDAQGDRLNGCGWEGWNGTWKEVQALIARYPAGTMVWVEVGIDAAESLEALDRGDYETELDDVEIWKAPA